MAYYLGFRGLFDDLLVVTTTSLQAARRLGDRAAEAEALTNLGLALHGLRRHREAVTAHQDAAAIFVKIGDWRGDGDALDNLGLALHGLYRNDEAVTAHQDAAAVLSRSVPGTAKARPSTTWASPCTACAGTARLSPRTRTPRPFPPGRSPA